MGKLHNLRIWIRTRMCFGLHCSLLVTSRWMILRVSLFKEKKRRHFKVDCVSKEASTSIHGKIKKKRPDNIFVNEYLTKTWSNLLYKLRSLRKNRSEHQFTVWMAISITKLYHLKSLYVWMIGARSINYKNLAYWMLSSKIDFGNYFTCPSSEFNSISLHIAFGMMYECLVLYQTLMNLINARNK